MKPDRRLGSVPDVVARGDDITGGIHHDRTEHPATTDRHRPDRGSRDPGLHPVGQRERPAAGRGGTTLAGYTAYTTKQPGPDLDLVARLSRSIDVPVVAEGRIHTPAHAAQALRAGAWTVVVGTAITHPSTITGWFTSAMANAGR
ncbi:hypothetical protein ABZ749_01670 [Micromonospora sp. NPDC047753]|uniref:hypothetical protein n=1 Tax=Micromonospora sp. NPDC047753 TaxID=3154817 RepID=UPI0033CDB047